MTETILRMRGITKVFGANGALTSLGPDVPLPGASSPGSVKVTSTLLPVAVMVP